MRSVPRLFAQVQRLQRPLALPRCVGPAPAERLQTGEWQRWRAAVEADHPSLGNLRSAVRSAGLVQKVYRRALHGFLLGLLESETLADAALFRDAGHEIPPEDLLCFIPSDLLTSELMDEIEAMAFDVRLAQQKAQAKRDVLIQEEKANAAEAESAERKPKRRLCRSSHDKTRQEMHRQYVKPW
mmetsp:Transcript_26408/g.61290  ORF Transcript_26408/g.61290 Transcript_26408/m.61290 type:complete len:184 (+) Transcript_26408:48-599(+)